MHSEETEMCYVCKHPLCYNTERERGTENCELRCSQLKGVMNGSTTKWNQGTADRQKRKQKFGNQEVDMHEVSSNREL